MFKMFVCAIAVAATMMFAAPVWADEFESMSVNDKMYDVDSQEYGAICTVLGGEPELSDVTVEEYLMVCRAWKGHVVLAAERGSEYRWVEDYSYKSGFFSTTTMSHMQLVEYIIAVDDRGNEFRYYL